MNFIFRMISILEGLSFVFLIFVAMPVKYIGKQDFLVKLIGMPHGLLFLFYMHIVVVFTGAAFTQIPQLFPPPFPQDIPI